MAITLESIETGEERRPIRVIVHSLPGMGKTSFAAGAPKPIFIQSEDGVGKLRYARFPRSTTFNHVIECVSFLLENKDHQYETVVLDSLDATEQLGHTLIREQHGETIFGDYGKGYKYALPFMERLLKGLTLLRERRNMNVIITSHSTIEQVKSPDVEPYGKYTMDVHKEVEKLFREWCDCLLFINQKVYTTSTDVGFNKKVVRGSSTGERYLFTEDRPAYYAKNRYSLPSEILLPNKPLQGWDLFMAEVEKGRQSGVTV